MDTTEKNLTTYPTIHNSVKIFATIIGKSRDQIQVSLQFNILSKTITEFMFAMFINLTNSIKISSCSI